MTIHTAPGGHRKDEIVASRVDRALVCRGRICLWSTGWSRRALGRIVCIGLTARNARLFDDRSCPGLGGAGETDGVRGPAAASSLAVALETEGPHRIKVPTIIPAITSPIPLFLLCMVISLL